MNKFDLTSLFALQKALDEEIHSLHHESYETTFQKRELALLVELGEFANETRCFKFWSLKKPSEKEVILDEYADAIHFFLSLGIAIGNESLVGEVTPTYEDLTKQLLLVYEEVALFSLSSKLEDYKTAFLDFLAILPLLGYSQEDLFIAYKKKLEVNYKRQENHY